MCFHNARCLKFTTARTSPLLSLGCAYYSIVVTDISSHCLELLAGQLRQDVLTVQQLSGSLVVEGACMLEQGATPQPRRHERAGGPTISPVTSCLGDCPADRHPLPAHMQLIDSFQPVAARWLKRRWLIADESASCWPIAKILAELGW